jgi:hypothetical protein
MEDKDIRSCISCAYTMKKCNGDCGKCDRGIERGDGDYDCKCIECYDERADVYRYYKPSDELLMLLGRE